jgi:hypothetical protein
MNLQPHQETVECTAYHCVIHAVDEPLEGYQLCMECGHVFLTPEELLEADAKALELMAEFPPAPPMTADMQRMLALLSPSDQPPMNTGARRVQDISFCPHCGHDF